MNIAKLLPNFFTRTFCPLTRHSFIHFYICRHSLNLTLPPETLINNFIPFLEQQSFIFNLLRSKTYCYAFFDQLNHDEKKALMMLLSEFADQPYIKIEKITPELLTKTMASDCAYYYWINSAKIAENSFEDLII